MPPSDLPSVTTAVREGVRLVDVALPVPVATTFTYEVPSGSPFPEPGARVLCPFGRRRLIGMAMGENAGPAPPKVRAIDKCLDPTPLVTGELVAFLKDMAAYYMSPLGEAVRLAMPPMEREVVELLAEPTLFPKLTRGVAPPRRQKVLLAIEGAVPKTPLRGQAAAVLAHVMAEGPTPLTALEARWKSARSAVARLADLGLARVEHRALEDASPPMGDDSFEAPPVATAEQETAIARIVEAERSAISQTFLLHGVTGSGKTEVYLRAVAVAQELGKGAIVLVPEIALTPQLVSRYRARFGDNVAVIHSQLSPKKRLAMWQRLCEGRALVAVGARSALFAPVRNLGLVIVDEEHDPSFKQEDGVRYHGRDMAILRARRAGGVVVLGSATPSLESVELTRSGKAELLRLRSRARGQAMPHIELVDLRNVSAGPSGDARISLPLHRALEETLAVKGQAILFLNRRGFAPCMRCLSCGKPVACKLCAVSLTYHARSGPTLQCHYCDHVRDVPMSCEACGKPTLSVEGMGTQKLEDTLRVAFPSARVERLDRDVAKGTAVEAVLTRMRNAEIDILVGTQMVTKGHDLPLVTLVGVIHADAALSYPDFRAAERTFQLLVQVAGRAGRGEQKGRVLLQTYSPEHPAIAFAARHDVDGFQEVDLADRRELGYPPFSHLGLVRVDGPDADATLAFISELAKLGRAGAPPDVMLLGPTEAPIARVRGRYRFRLLVRAPKRSLLRPVLHILARACAAPPTAVRAVVDIDPVDFL